MARPPTNWKLISGWILFCGIALIGVAFLVEGFGIATNSVGVATAETFVSLIGFGIIVVGLSFALGRMG